VTVWIATGANFIGFKVALETIPPFLLMTARLIGAGVILLAVCRRWGPVVWPGRRQMVSAMTAGTLLLVVGQGGIVWGLQHLPAGSSALFASSSPLFLAAFQYLFLGDRLSAGIVGGILLGFSGLVMMSVLSPGDSAPQPAAIGFVLAGSASWALGSLVENRTGESSNPMLTSALQALWGGSTMALATLLSGELAHFDLHGVSGRSLVAVAYLTVFGMAISFATFVWLNGTTTPTLANTFQYVSPIVALVVASWMLHEPIGWGKAVSAAVVLAGVACIVSATGGAGAKEQRTCIDMSK
jgi:drug/metabolite transporter (DMT)-like permease